MKLTKSQLRKIIKEELESISEAFNTGKWDWSEEEGGDVDLGGTPFSDSFDGRQSTESPQTSEDQHWINLIAAVHALSSGDVRVSRISGKETPVSQRERLADKIQQLMADTREE